MYLYLETSTVHSRSEKQIYLEDELEKFPAMWNKLQRIQRPTLLPLVLKYDGSTREGVVLLHFTQRDGRYVQREFIQLTGMRSQVDIPYKHGINAYKM